MTRLSLTQLTIKWFTVSPAVYPNLVEFQFNTEPPESDAGVSCTLDTLRANAFSELYFQQIFAHFYRPTTDEAA